MVCLVWSLSGLFLATSGEPLKNFLVLHMCGAFLIPPVLLVFGALVELMTSRILDRSDEVLQSFKKQFRTNSRGIVWEVARWSATTQSFLLMFLQKVYSTEVLLSDYVSLDDKLKNEQRDSTCCKCYSRCYSEETMTCYKHRQLCLSLSAFWLFLCYFYEHIGPVDFQKILFSVVYLSWAYTYNSGQMWCPEGKFVFNDPTFN